MDKVKVFLTILNAQKFWVTTTILAILPVVFWFLSKSDLDNQAADRTGKIMASYKIADAVNQMKNHPNPISADGMDENIDRLENSVLLAWANQFEQQKKVLV